MNKALGETLLHRAARLGRKDIVIDCLHNATCDLNGKDNAGYTPLHEACTRGHVKIARILLQYGANVNQAAPGGISSLHEAVENDHIEVCRLLLAYGADPSVATYAGLTPLKLARTNKMIAFLKGVLADITGDCGAAIETKQPPPPAPLAWKFSGNKRAKMSGCDVFAGVPSDRELDENIVLYVSECDALFDDNLKLDEPDVRAQLDIECFRFTYVQ